MKDFLVLFREPDGRKTVPSSEFQQRHQQHWKSWLERITLEGTLTAGKPLTLRGSVIKRVGEETTVIEGPSRIGEEIIGGYLLIKADNLSEATTTIKSCPVFEAGGYAEVREIM